MSFVTGEKAQSILGNHLVAARANGLKVAERVLAEIPQDTIYKHEAMRFCVDNHSVYVGLEGGYRLVPHALEQAATRMGMPSKYIKDLVAGEPWQQGLAEHCLRTVYDNQPGRALVRRVGYSVRGIVSDKFRRLSSPELMETFVGGVEKYGHVIAGGHGGDTRVSMRSLYPEVIDVRPGHGEYVALGLEWGNSDFGDGAHRISLYMLRVVCLNGMVGRDVLRNVHLGKRLDDSITYREETYQLDTRATSAALSDMIAAVASPEARTKTIEMIRAKAEEEVTVGQLRSRYAKLLTKDELDDVVTAFEGPDVINLPPVQTVWRASNALSWVAKQAEPSRQLDLERMAGVDLGLGA